MLHKIFHAFWVEGQQVVNWSENQLVPYYVNKLVDQTWLPTLFSGMEAASMVHGLQVLSSPHNSSGHNSQYSLSFLLKRDGS